METLYLFLDRNLILFLLIVILTDAATCLRFVLKKSENESMAEFRRKLDIITAISYSIILVYVGFLIIAEIILNYQINHLMLFMICLILDVKNIIEAIIDKNIENKEQEDKKWSKYWRGDRK